MAGLEEQRRVGRVHRPADLALQEEDLPQGRRDKPGHPLVVRHLGGRRVPQERQGRSGSSRSAAPSTSGSSSAAPPRGRTSRSSHGCFGRPSLAGPTGPPGDPPHCPSPQAEPPRSPARVHRAGEPNARDHKDKRPRTSYARGRGRRSAKGSHQERVIRGLGRCADWWGRGRR